MCDFLLPSSSLSGMRDGGTGNEESDDILVDLKFGRLDLSPRRCLF